MGDQVLDYTENYKYTYLGEVINDKWNLDSQIKEVKAKTEAAYQTILSIAGDRNFLGMQMEVIWRLFDSCIVPLLTYAAAAWNPRKKDLEELDQIQEGIIKRILMLPVSTPREALYAETGLLDMEHHEMRQRINLKQRVNENPYSLVARVLMPPNQSGTPKRMIRRTR